MKRFYHYGRGGHLGHMTQILRINFHSPALWRLQMKCCLNRPSGMFENVDDRRTTNAWPRGYKTFFMLNSVEHEIFPAHKY